MSILCGGFGLSKGAKAGIESKLTDLTMFPLPLCTSAIEKVLSIGEI